MNFEMLANINAHPRDAAITFEEVEHKYTIQGMPKHPISTTTLIHIFFAPFNPEATASIVMDKPNSEYFYTPNPALTPHQEHTAREAHKAKIVQTWKDAATLGTLMHADIENFFNGLPVKNPTCTEHRWFQMFWQEFQRTNPGWKPFRTEWVIYDENKGVAGSIDFTVVNAAGDLVIMDWKRAKNISKSGFGKYGFGPFTKLQDCNYSHYTLQLNIYRHILETQYHKRVLGMYMVCLHPNNKGKCYEVYLIDPYPIAEVWDAMFEYAHAHHHA